MTAVIKSSNDINKIVSTCEGSLGLVPTMGALHAGHISLIENCKKECKTTVVSIFVNPKQFGPNEDYSKYPRTIESDIGICKNLGVDYIFAPEVNDIYPENENIIIPPKELTNMLCGITRPHLFQGVATVVKKLFEIIKPDYAYFGEKDLQQLYVIKWLVNHFKIQTFIRSCPIIREKNGLACSSRNKYLNDHEIKIASNLYKALQMAKRDIRSGMFTPSKALLECLVSLSQIPEVKVEYLDARVKDTLEKANENITSGFYFLIAAHINNVRLIDNIEI